MKNIFALSLSVLLCTVVFAGGTDTPSRASGVAVVKKDASTFNLIYKAEKAGFVKVSILDSKQRTIFQESIKTSEGFTRPYNLESLEKGEYTLEIVDDSGTQVEKLRNYSDKVEKLFNVRKIPGQDKLLLTVAGKGKETISVKIYDESERLVYEKDEYTTDDFARVYNLKNLKGAVTFEVTGESGESTIVQY
ncbi:MAG: hypothetical protein JJE09_08290 [Bacteroidia bacterium]|nr:hypothetical protein [Bacteroidia bacterium]